VEEERVGDAVGRDLDDAAEEQDEEQHLDERLQHRPRHAEYRLAVADLHVAPGEEEEQLPVLPELAEPADGRDAGGRRRGGWSDRAHREASRALPFQQTTKSPPERSWWRRPSRGAKSSTSGLHDRTIPERNHTFAGAAIAAPPGQSTSSRGACFAG